MSKELPTNGTVTKPDWQAEKAEKQATGEAEGGNNRPSLVSLAGLSGHLFVR